MSFFIIADTRGQEQMIEARSLTVDQSGVLSVMGCERGKRKVEVIQAFAPGSWTHFRKLDPSEVKAAAANPLGRFLKDIPGFEARTVDFLSWYGVVTLKALTDLSDSDIRAMKRWRLSITANIVKTLANLNLALSE